MKIDLKRNLCALVFILLSSSMALAANREPACIAEGQPLPVYNEQVLQWKEHTKNKYENRGHIDGILAKVYPNKSGHLHMSVQIGEKTSDTIEVIYNLAFGKVARFNVGVRVEACGDYITANARSGKYDPSPDGAILHWVHRSTNSRHDSGFMTINGVVYGN